ncbi:MAG TPA: kinase [Porphyromonadaceae bacterium]|nr:kinase [Porphyromonadaceae bacterium]
MITKHNLPAVIVIAMIGLSWAFGVKAQGELLPATNRPNPLYAAVPDTIANRLDTLNVGKDTLIAPAADSLSQDTIKKSANALDAIVDYQATDSIVMTNGNWAYLFGEGKVKYEQIELESEEINMNLDSSLVFAKYGLDSIGAEFGFPLFKDGGEQYEAKTMKYNFKTKKGYITELITQQGEGFVVAGESKKMENNDIFMKGGKYTTCDNHDHPHFYFQLTKAKVRPQKNVVTGPAYLVMEDVPLPIAVPFGFFPFSQTYSSGIIMPTFGDENARGFYLRDGGYYFALSDYIDLALTGEIYTKGSWGLQARSNYRKRYKYSGGFNLAYLVTKLGDKGLPDYSKSKDFKITWNHSQDPKANPFSTLSASVNFSTSSYDRQSLTGMYNPNLSTQNTKSSSINYTRRFPNSPWSLTANTTINQRSRDSTVSVTLPDLNVTMSRIYPFKRKKAMGDQRWYEKISMSYSMYFRNSIETKENLLFKSNFIKDWKNAFKHDIPVQATFNLFKYINVTPSFNYTERWYTSKVDQSYDLATNTVVKDTVFGFNRVYNYSGSVSASTKLYGFYKPLPFLGDKVQMIRHVFTPSVSYSNSPDFGAKRYGYYKEMRYIDAYGNEKIDYYSPYQSQIFGVPGRGKTSMVSFDISNNVEMKVKSDSDSTGIKKISIIDNLGLSSAYNFAADSLNWSNIAATMRLKLTKDLTLNVNGMFDVYTYQADRNGNPVRVNVPRWKVGKGIGRLQSANTSFSYTFNQDTFKKWFSKGDKDSGSDVPEGGENTTDQEAVDGELTGTTTPSRRNKEKKDEGEYDSDGYYVNKIPWSLSLSYTLAYGYGTFDSQKLEYNRKLTQGLTFSGNISPTKNWSLNFSSSYDFDLGKITYMTCGITRNMHCWNMSMNFIPVGPYKSYNFSIAVSSSMLKDLKYNKSNNYRDNLDWY